MEGILAGQISRHAGIGAAPIHAVCETSRRNLEPPGLCSGGIDEIGCAHELFELHGSGSDQRMAEGNPIEESGGERIWQKRKPAVEAAKQSQPTSVRAASPFAGLRSAEIQRLEWADVMLDRGWTKCGPKIPRRPRAALCRFPKISKRGCNRWPTPARCCGGAKFGGTSSRWQKNCESSGSRTSCATLQFPIGLRARATRIELLLKAGTRRRLFSNITGNW